MNNTSIISAELLRELESEATATRNCLERVDAKLFDWKPHEKSMPLGYLALIVAEIPKWITVMIEKSEIDYATFEHYKPQTANDLVKHFDENMQAARNALQKTTDENLTENFFGKYQGQIVNTAPKKESISSSINHLVHHRGQLTVYLRLNDIAVPSIYGPSGDTQKFQ